MFDSLYQDETDQALRFEAATPRVTPKEKPGVMAGTLTAIPSGIVQGGLQFGASVLDVLNEYGKAAAFREGAPKDQSIDRMFTEQQPEAKALRSKAKEWDPDPATTGTAAQIVQGFANIGTKVVGSVLLGGPTAPAILGASEGITEGIGLADKGVDASTAATAGLVKGALTAAGAALPIAGTTAAATAGLVVVGGPVAFMAEQATIREILRSANYDDLAAQYDPFDVVGLTASLVAPAAFGAAAHALRAKGKAAEPAPTIRPPEEVVDAARVALLDQHDLDVVQGRAKAEGKPIIEAMAEQPAGRQAAAERIERGEPIVSRETAAPAAVTEPVEAVAAKSEPADAPPAAAEPTADVPVMRFDSRGDLVEAGTAPREEVAKGWRVQKVLLEQLRECLGA